MCASSHLSLSLLLCWTREGDPQNRLSRLFGLTSSRRGLGRRCRHFRQRRQDRTCLPAGEEYIDTSERINRTNERVRQTAVNGVVGHLRSGSTFGSVVLLCSGDKRKPEEGGAAPPPPPTPPYDEIKGDRERGDGQKVPILSTRTHTRAREINREETVIRIYIYCFQRD